MRLFPVIISLYPLAINEFRFSAEFVSFFFGGNARAGHIACLCGVETRLLELLLVRVSVLRCSSCLCPAHPLWHWYFTTRFCRRMLKLRLENILTAIFAPSLFDISFILFSPSSNGRCATLLISINELVSYHLDEERKQAKPLVEKGDTSWRHMTFIASWTGLTI